MLRHRSPPWGNPSARQGDDAAVAGGAQDADDVPSPCTAVCSLGRDDVCPSCFRSIAEITGWIGFTCAQKRAAIANAAERRAAT